MRRQQLRNLLATLLLSTGVPMIAAGDEFGRTQRGNNNAYCQDNEISWYDWQWEPWQSDLKVFASQVLRLRRLHSAFRQRYFFDGQPLHAGGPKDLAWLGPDGREIAEAAWHAADSRTLGMFLAGESHGLDDDGRPIRDQSFLVLMHAGATPVVVHPPRRSLRTRLPPAHRHDDGSGRGVSRRAARRVGGHAAAAQHPRLPWLSAAGHSAERPLSRSGRCGAATLPVLRRREGAIRKRCRSADSMGA